MMNQNLSDQVRYNVHITPKTKEEISDILILGPGLTSEKYYQNITQKELFDLQFQYEDVANMKIEVIIKD